MICVVRCRASLLSWGCLSTFSEVELESNSNMAKVPHSSSPCSLSPNRLLAPIIFSDTAEREATRGATTLLKVKATAAAPHTEGVGFVPPLPEASSLFPLFGSM